MKTIKRKDEKNRRRDTEGKTGGSTTANAKKERTSTATTGTAEKGRRKQ